MIALNDDLSIERSNKPNLSAVIVYKYFIYDTYLNEKLHKGHVGCPNAVELVSLVIHFQYTQTHTYKTHRNKKNKHT